MITRSLSARISRYLKEYPVIAVIGPRQVGKTTLVKTVTDGLKKKILYLDLERTSDVRRLEADAEQYLTTYSDECVIIDEIQRMPGLFPLLRSLVDEKRVPARFIITGSASPDLLMGASESLAGRIHYFRLNPVGLHELPATISVNKHWLRGGFPRPLSMRPNELASSWLERFITTFIERDLPMLFDIRFSTVVMRKLWGMLGHLHGSIFNAERLAASLDVSGPTIKRYIDHLEGAFIIHRLRPYYVNISKRLIKAPRIYFTDTGILHSLLRIKTMKDLVNHPSLGVSWEGYVITQIINALPSHLDAYFYRTHAGAECDLVLAHGNVVKACIEIKYSVNPVTTRGFYQAMSDLKCKKGFIVSPAEVDYLNRNNTRITGLQKFLKKHLGQLS